MAAPQPDDALLRTSEPPGGDPFEKHPLDWARRLLPDYFSDPPADFHRELLGALAAGTRLVARVAPRGHAKSTCAALAYPLWALCTGRKRNIVIVTHEGSLARQFVRDLRIELESNDELRARYPHVCPSPERPPEVWRDARITIDGRSVQARGTGASLRGTRVGPHRPDLIICDDIEKDRHVRSPEQREALRHWLRRVATPALSPDGQLVVLGSIIHHESLLAELRDRRRFPRWDYRVYRALEFPDGDADGAARPSPLWPQRWSYARLIEERARIGTAAFEQEYQANPIEADLQVFRRAWLRGYEQQELVPQRLVTLMAVDPATGIAGGDFFALWIGGQDTHTGVLYTYELTLERINIVDQVARILSAGRFYRPVRIGIETVGYQKALKDALDDASRKQRLYLPVVDLRTHANKRARIEGIAPLLENGSLRLPKTIDDEVYHQFLRFPHARHDDAPDVCAMAVELARTWRAGPPETVFNRVSK